MISKVERKRLKKALGKHYTQPVLAQLEAEKAVGLNGQPFTANMIRRVFNGYPYPVIEDAIYKAAEIAIEEQKREKARRQRFLKTL